MNGAPRHPGKGNSRSPSGMTTRKASAMGHPAPGQGDSGFGGRPTHDGEAVMNGAPRHPGQGNSRSPSGMTPESKRNGAPRIRSIYRIS